MSEVDFTYKISEDFNKRVIQYLLQLGNKQLAEAFQFCKYEYEDVGFAYYAGLRGDNWNKKALDFTFEGTAKNISILKSANKELKYAIGKALKPSKSGFLIRGIFYLDKDIPLENIIGPFSNEERLNCDIEIAKNVLNDLIQIGGLACLNVSYNAKSSENSINDYFRDMLTVKGYEQVKDQSRHGVSANGKDAAEVDLLLTKDGKEIAIFEGMKLNSVNTAYIDEHISKSITNYNALGTATFIVAYVNSADFESFWKRYSDHILHYAFPLKKKKDFHPLVHPNAATRLASMILTRDGFDFPVYFIAFKINHCSK